MVVVWVLGLMLAFHLGAFGQWWFTAKLAMVVGLTGYQGWLGTYGKRLAGGKRPLDNRTLRMMNEIPGIAAAIIVVLVIVKPF
jgi:protoporphyrinogen IX oxidase